MQISELNNRRIAVWGLGREGRAVLKFLRSSGIDQQPTLFLDQNAPDNEASRSGVKEVISDPARLSEFDVVIKSPGVSLYRPEIATAKRAGVQFTSATNLALAALDLKRVIGVTGTKGKSTTSSLIAHLLRGLGKSVVFAGNIGVPILETLAERERADYYVLELSSYQIADLQYFPHISVLTNLYRDHITWHGSLEQYHEDKLRLFRHPKVTAVLNAADEAAKQLGPSLSGEVCWFNTTQSAHLENDAYFIGARKLFPASLVQLPGEHNRLNVLAALTVCSRLTLSLDNAGAVLSTFQPLPHRLTVLGERDGITYVDDSISTVPETAIAALKCFPEKHVTLLLGGLDRGQDWRAFAKMVQAAAPQAILTIPDNGEQIASAIRELAIPTTLIECASLGEAVERATKITPAGGIVLLSPASASFPRFTNFEERGNTFAAAAGFAAQKLSVPSVA